MKYKLLKISALITLLSACAQLQNGVLPESLTRPKSIRGEVCMESPRLKVLQILNNGILAHVCPVDYPSFYDDAFDACSAKGDLVFMAVAPKANDYVDDQKITLSQAQCFVGAGIFSYETSQGYKKTVRNIKILEEVSEKNEIKK